MTQVDHIFNDHQLRHKFQVTEEVTGVETEKDDREKLITDTWCNWRLQGDQITPELHY